MRYLLSTFCVCVIAVALVVTPAMAVLTDGLVAYWPLDDGSGATARDVSGNGQDGTVEGAVWVPSADAKVGTGALRFDGQDDRISLGGMNVEGDGITIACWFFTDNLDTPGNDPRMVSKAIGGANEEHWWMISSSRQGGTKVLRFRLRTDGVTAELKADTVTGFIETGVWTHSVATWDGSTMRLYKDGVEAGSIPKGGKLDVDAGVEAAIGNQPTPAGDRPFEGILDDVALWNRALSEGEINELMTNGLPAAVDAHGNLVITWGSLKE